MKVSHQQAVDPAVLATDRALPRIVALTVTTHAPAPTRPYLTS